MQKTLCKKEFKNCEIVKENKELQERIDKVIEYMNKWGEQPDYDMYIEMKDYQEFQDILKILKGE